MDQEGLALHSKNKTCNIRSPCKQIYFTFCILMQFFTFTYLL